MTTNELLSLYATLETEIQKLKPFTDEMLQLSKQIDHFSGQLVSAVLPNGLDDKAINQVVSSRSSIVDLATKFAQSFDMLANHSQLIEVKKTIKQRKHQPELSEFSKEFQDVEELLTEYEITTKLIYEFVKTRDMSLLVSMIAAIRTAAQKYQEMTKANSLVLGISQRTEENFDVESFPDYRSIQIHFYNDDHDLESFVSHFVSVSVIYEELKLLTQMPDARLKIMKIESGSFFEKFFGAEKLIEIFGKLLERVIDLVFRKFTQEGQVARKKEVISLIRDQIDLVRMCKEAGLAVDERNDELIQKAVVTVSGELLKLALQSTRVKIDDKELSIGKGHEGKYLKETARLLLEENEQKD